MTPPPAEQFAARIFMGPALRAQPDRRLVDLVRDGYDAAFEEIVRRYRRQLDRFAAAIVGGRSEDVTQDAFSKALLALRGSEAEVELRPWLYRIVRNTALNDLRDRAPATDELPEEGLPGGRSAAAEVVAREELTDLMQRLRSLPEPQRAAIVMRELEGLGHEEIAAALGVTGGAARQVIFRARAALRDGLGLLIPVPLVRALAEHGGEAGRAGGAIAGASASSAGGAALGGLGGGALKAGMATVLIAGAVGAGVAVEHHNGSHSGPEAADAAPLVQHQGGSDAAESETASSNTSSGSNNRESGSHGGSGKSASGHDGNDSSGGSLGGSHRGPGDGPGHSGSGSGKSGSSSGPGSQSPSSGSGSGGDDHHGGSSGSGKSGSDDGSGGGGSIGSSDGSSSGGSGSDDGGSSGSGSGSGDGGSDGGTITEPAPTPELDQSDDGGSGSGSESPDNSGSGDLSGGGSGSLDGSSIAP